ncbi:MAG: DNA-directed RNA polymerase subunit omega [Candidatus Omnitrophota bacterium]|jgi:DNA-directed RNA polymerase omega subunit
MTYIPIEKIMTPETGSRFKTVLAIAQRANELAAGAAPLVKCESKKVSTIAMKEFAEGKVRYEEIKPKSKKAAG